MRALAAVLGCLLCAGCLPAITWNARSPDHRVLVEARRDGRRSCLHVTGRAPACHEAVALDALVLSEDGAHLAYPARAGTRWTVVRDTRLGRWWEGVASPVLSRDGTRLAYAALDSGAWRVVVDDSALGRYDSLYTGTLRFDGAGRRLAFVAQRGDTAFAVVDGVEHPAGEAVAQLAFSADGARVGWLARSASAAMLVVDGRVVATHERIVAFAFAPGATGVAYVAMDEGRWQVVADGHRAGPFDAVRALAWAPDGDPTWVARDRAGEHVARAGALGPAWDSVGTPVFGRTGGHWGYVAHDSAGTAVIVDGVAIARETWAGNLVLGADSGRAVWLARRGEGTVVVDGHAAHPFDLVVDGTLLLLRDGRTWAVLAGEPRRRRLYVVVEGVNGRRPFDWSENTRLAARDPSGAALRAWVAAEAELMVSGRDR